ncbi:MAG: metallophosphoesterase [Bacillota bacterium]
MRDVTTGDQRTRLSPLATAGTVLFIMLLAITAASTYWPRVNELEIGISSLPPALDGTRILHISDLHSRSPHNLTVDIPAALGDRSFDLACITGDFIDNDLEQLPPALDLVRSLGRRAPVITVLGNHDWPPGGRHVVAELEYAGAVHLENESAVVGFDDFEFPVVGISDAYSGYDDVAAGFEDVEGEFALVLTHDPKIFGDIARSHPSVVLAGHTHGGQIRLPLLPTLYAPGAGFFPEYGEGVYREDGSVMYVSRGIGASGPLPFRFWNRPEITIITLRRGG